MNLPAAGVRIMVASRPVDFRNGLDGLAAMVQQSLHESPFAGDLFVFRAKRADRVKICIGMAPGYACFTRVSTYGQTLDAQLEQLRGAGCTKIYREKVTGAHSDRRELLKMLDALDAGDVVTVTRIDRLARSTFDLFGIVKRIVDTKAQFRSLAEPWANTGTSTERLMLTVLGGLANVERDPIQI